MQKMIWTAEKKIEHIDKDTISPEGPAFLAE